MLGKKMADERSGSCLFHSTNTHFSFLVATIIFPAYTGDAIGIKNNTVWVSIKFSVIFMRAQIIFR
jgi:hypothetical protein